MEAELLGKGVSLKAVRSLAEAPILNGRADEWRETCVPESLPGSSPA
jgi:hypothetical protein